MEAEEASRAEAQHVAEQRAKREQQRLERAHHEHMVRAVLLKLPYCNLVLMRQGTNHSIAFCHLPAQKIILCAVVNACSQWFRFLLKLVVTLPLVMCMFDCCPTCCCLVDDARGQK